MGHSSPRLRTYRGRGSTVHTALTSAASSENGIVRSCGVLVITTHKILQKERRCDRHR